jgi:hypothetical protein
MVVGESLEMSQTLRPSNPASLSCLLLLRVWTLSIWV